MRPEAVAAMAPFLTERFANPSGAHTLAQRSKAALEEARERCAALLGAAAGELVFTGGGTEADNLAVIGAARAARDAGRGDVVVTTTFEHKAVLAAATALEQEGFSVRRVAVDRRGIVDLDALAAALDDRTAVVSVMLVNNEVGTIQPLAEGATIVRERAPQAVLHTDAVQAVPWLDVTGAAAPADLVSVSAHKFGGPKGTGVLVVRDGVALRPLLVGGGQERGLRAGTVDVAGAVAMTAAFQATHESRDADGARVRVLRDRLQRDLQESLPEVFVNGDLERKVAGNCHLRFEGVEAEALLVALDLAGVCAAAGSSCASGALEPSHVLLAMGLTREEARASVRFSLGFASSDADVDLALEVVPEVVTRLRRAPAAALSR